MVATVLVPWPPWKPHSAEVPHPRRGASGTGHRSRARPPPAAVGSPVISATGNRKAMRRIMLLAAGASLAGLLAGSLAVPAAAPRSGSSGTAASGSPAAGRAEPGADAAAPPPPAATTTLV